MAQINRSGTVTFGDASINIWEEPERTSIAQWNEWEKLFRKQVFKRFIQQLNRLGWHVGEWDEADEYRCIAHDHRTCTKGDLQGQLEIAGRTVKFQMWQDVANITREDGKGRHEFDKEQRMPYLIHLEMQRTRNRLRDYFCNVFAGYGFKDYSPNTRRPGPGGLTALEWVDREMRSSCHYVEELGHARIGTECNARSAEGETITHGCRVYTLDSKGRIVTGTAYYNLNQSWYVVTGKYGVFCSQASEIYLHNPGCLRVKRNERQRRQRLEREMAKAIKVMDFKRAQVLKEVLFPENEPLYLIWHKGHSAWYAPNFCGYRNSANDAGKYTRAELGSYITEDDLTKAVPLEEAA
ncbi:hypothetical protein [Halomonas sp. KHS3]|uniref:hypothetical protein n=1 Tax=Halomonas sp. KHS3 TaxID=866350 RepID=UPI00059AE24F|nr:hypothetical protein [Halomonas sp. KHS3]KIN13455.1 hypothetical protein RO22_19500 [Halomonas sp. KHS3]